MLEVAGLCVERKGRSILRDVSFTVHEPQLLGVIGHNGAGKTTLMRSIVGLQSASAGDIAIRGRRGERDRRRLVSYLPQGGLPFPDATVSRIVGTLAPPAIEGAKDPLGELVRDTSRRRLSSLSGGERRLVGVWVALAVDTPVVVLDEPSNDLDPERRAQMWSTLHANVARGQIVIVVTHNLHELDQQASRLLLLRGGALTFDGSVKELARQVGGSRVQLPSDVAERLGPEHVDLTLAVERGSTVTLTIDPGALPALLGRVAELAPAALADITVSQPSLVDAYQRFDRSVDDVDA